MKNNFIIFSFAVLLLSQYSCSIENREDLAKDYLKSQIDSASNHLLAFSNFEKVDGIERQKESLTYEMTFKGFVGAVRDSYWDGYINSSASASSLAEGLYGSSYGIGRNGLLGMNVSLSLEELNQKDSYTRQYSLYKKGDGHFVKGYIIFEKRDSGWKILEMDIKHDQEASVLYNQKQDMQSSVTEVQKVDTTSMNTDVPTNQYAVSTNKAYFYSEPDKKTRKRSYLVQDNIIEPLKEENEFFYVEFNSFENFKSSKGWIEKKCLIQIK